MERGKRRTGRWLASAGLALAALASGLAVSAAPAGAAIAPSTIRFWGPNVDYTGDAGTAKVTRAMVKLGNTLFIGGNFDQIRPEPNTATNITVTNGVAQPFLYAVDATTGVYLPQFAPALNGAVEALEIDPVTNTLYVGGAFSSVNGQSLTGLAALDPATGALKGAQRTVVNNGVGASIVYGLHRNGRSLYVGGQFTSIGGSARGQLARLLIDQSNTVDPAFQSYFTGGKVLSIATDDTKVFVGGEFTALKTGPGGTDVAGTSWIGAVSPADGSTLLTWTSLPPCTGSSCTTNPPRVRTLAVANGLLFVGYGGANGRLSALRTADGSLASPTGMLNDLAASWRVNGDVQALRVAGNRLFMAGHFTGVFGLNIARCNFLSASFANATNASLQLQPEPNLQNGGHLGAFAIVAEDENDTYWAGHITRTDVDCDTGAGTTNYSNVLRLVDGGGATDTTAPTAPTNVTRTDGSGGSVTVSWTAATDDTAVTAYYALVNGVARKLVAGSATSVTFTAADGIDPANPGTLKLQALDPYGNLSVKSATAAAPPPPTTTTTTTTTTTVPPTTTTTTVPPTTTTTTVPPTTTTTTVPPTTTTTTTTVPPTTTTTVPPTTTTTTTVPPTTTTTVPPSGANAAGEFSPLAAPRRIFDTRFGIGGPTAPVTAGQARSVKVTGVGDPGGIPASGAGMVALNVTVVSPSAAGYLTVYPNGEGQPNASNLNFQAGQTVPNLVLARVGSGGIVNLALSAGSAHVVIDAVGWVADTTVTTPGSRTEPLAPVRALDTRTGLGRPVGAGQTIEVQVVPAGQGYSGVVVNLTGVSPTSSTYVTAFPGDVPTPPVASNLNLRPGETRPNLVMVGVSPAGTIKLFNEAGSVHLLVDVVGRFKASAGLDTTAAGRIVALGSPTRLVDTRGSTGPLGPTATKFWDLSALGAYAPAGSTVRGVIMNTTAVAPTAPSYLTIYPGGTARPNASNLNTSAGNDVPNLSLAMLGAASGVTIYNDTGSVNYLFDATAIVLG